MATVNEQVTDSVTQANVKVLGDAPAQAMAMLYQGAAQSVLVAMQNQVANQQANDLLRNASTTQAINKLLNIDPTEALSLVKANSGNDVAGQLSALLAALASGQQGAKVAQSTPPETATAT